MKIGILTHQYVNNYGAFLQAYALREAVQGLFPEDEVQIINYVNVKHFIINTGGWYRFYRTREGLKEWLQKTKLPWTFGQERKKIMVLSSRCYNAEQINRLNFDCIIVGSDEVWNYQDSKANAPVKFGQGLKCKKLIAYAPSVGQTTLKNGLPTYVEHGLKRFSAISVRDDSTFEIVQNVTGGTSTRVLDPTFLVDFPRSEQKVQKPYILFYYCDHLPAKVRNQIFDYAKKYSLAVYGAGECDKKYTDVTVNLTPFEWVEMFKNAEFVFTGTFHGAVFSILHQKPFKVYLTNHSRVKKVSSLLHELGIGNREIDGSFEFDLDQMKTEIDYAAVFGVIERMRDNSLNYLKNAIGQL